MRVTLLSYDFTNWDSNRAFTAIFDNKFDYNYYRRLKINSEIEKNKLVEKILVNFEKQYQFSLKRNKRPG